MTVFQSLLNNSFVVSRRVRTDDGQGGWTISYLELGTVEGRICPATSNERVVADAEEQQITHVLYVEHGEDIARGDLVICDDLTVEVLGVREPSKAGKHLEIDCLERQQESTEEYGT